MLTRLKSILLIFILLSTSVTPLVFFAGYSLNKEYISTVLCVNKTKPKLECKGKCYLNKKIKQAEEKEQKSGSFSKNSLEVFITSQTDFHFFTFQTDEYLIHSSVLYFLSSVDKIFQPPRLNS